MYDFNTFATGAHITLGTLAVVSGAIALAARKGATIHIGAGRLFAVSMCLSSALGAVLSVVKFEYLYITFHAGLLGVTLILSSWLTVRIRQHHRGRWFWMIGVVNFLNAASLVAAGWHALSLPDGVLFGFHAEDYFFLSVMAGIAMIGDLSLLFRKALSSRHRIARHLWRMCLGFFIAAGSAFTGPGATAFPEAIRNSGVLSLPELIIISLMLFWLLRTLFWQSEPAKRSQG